MTDPAADIARLGALLRAEGVASTLHESLLALEALDRVDRTDPADVHMALRSAFCTRPEDLPPFDRCFWRWWGGDDARDRSVTRGDDARNQVAGRMTRAGGVHTEAGTSSREAPEDAPETPDTVGAVYSPIDSLARRSFATVGEDELRAFDAWIDRLMIRLSARRSRRREPGGRRGVLDVRRTLRESARHDGEWIRLHHRRRKLDPPRLVVLCDVSGSMERYSRFLIRFLLGCARAGEIETFAFSTRLVHLTPWLARAGIDDALAELRSRGWSSGTRIGECLQSFLDRFGTRMLGRRTIVIILSDGLDQGEVEPLERAMSRIRRRVRRIIWLNPLLESSRYAPEARGMQAALPYVDRFQAGHSLEALRDLPASLRL